MSLLCFLGKERALQQLHIFESISGKKQISKFEFKEKDVYYVIAQYLEIDGKPSIIEYVKALGDDPFTDEDGRSRFIEKLFNFEDILYTDALTGIYNRRYYEDKIKMSRDTLGVAVMDIDDFKLYNDQFGHNVGDLVLKTVAREIKNCLGKNERIIRFGGDEFLLLSNTSKAETLALKMKLIKEHLNEIAIPNYPKLHISVSIGGAICQDETIEEAVERADQLMYCAKNEKNQFYTEGDIPLNENRAIIDEYHNATRQKILIVDDSELNRSLLSEILKNDFEILEAENGKDALKLLKEYGTGISLVLLDIIMPVMDGFGVLEKMRDNHWIEDIPVIMISSDTTDSNISRAYEMGVYDYIKRPFNAKVVISRARTTIKSNAKQQRLMSIVSEQIYEKDRDQKMMTVILSHIVQFHNGESRLHTLHINVLTEMLLKKLVTKTKKYDLSWDTMKQIVTASSLHDIGKIGIPSEILNKPGKLTEEEFEIIKKHTILGEEMLKDIYRYKDEPLVRISKEICRWHHERYDGNGYPDGLKGEEIPISAQVVALADVYDALVSERVYKKALPQEEALRMIQNGECGQFNPLLVQCLLEIKDSIKDKYDVNVDDDYII